MQFSAEYRFYIHSKRFFKRNKNLHTHNDERMKKRKDKRRYEHNFWIAFQSEIKDEEKDSRQAGRQAGRRAANINNDKQK